MCIASLLGKHTGSVDFIGFITTGSLNSFTLLPGKDIGATNNTSEEFFLDTLVFARPIPEPMSLFLIVIGLLGFRASRWLA